MLASLHKSLGGSTNGSTTVASLMQRKPTKFGYLLREGGNMVKTWRRRYCILCEATLYYFKDSRKDTKPAGKVALSGATVRTAGKVTGKQHSFEIHVPGRIYYFQAESDKEREEWILTLHAATGEAAGSNVSLHNSSSAATQPSMGDLSIPHCGRFLVQATSWLVATNGVASKGLFCQAGISNEIAEIRRLVASGETDVSGMSPYSVAAAIKIFLIESEPIIPHSHFLRYVAVAEGNKTEGTRWRELKQLLHELPAARQQILDLLIHCLHETSCKAPEQGTPAQHLAVIFAPLIAPPVDLPNYFPQLASNTLLLIQNVGQQHQHIGKEATNILQELVQAAAPVPS